MDRHLPLLLLATVALAAPALAQQPVPTAPSRVLRSSEIPAEVLERLRADGAAITSVSPQDPQTNPKADPKAAAAQKALLQAMQKAPLDRRSSTILKEWAKPEPKPVDEDPDLKLPEALTEEAPKPPEPAQPPQPEGEPPTDPDEKAAWEAAHKAKLEAFQTAQKEAQAAFQKVQKEFQTKQAEWNKETAKIKAKRQARKLELYRRAITLGQWDRLPKIFESIDEKQRKPFYQQMLGKLLAPPQKNSNSRLRPFLEQNEFTFDDILALVAIAPGGYEKEQGKFLAPLISKCFQKGHNFEEWQERLRREVARPDAERRLNQRQAALILTAQNRNAEMGEFLPSRDKAVADDDREGLNLLARHHVALWRKDEKPEQLKDAWLATMAALAPGKIEDKVKKEALTRAVELAPKVQIVADVNWLEESFTSRPERGMEVIATIGSEASTGMVLRANDPDRRLRTMKLLSGAVNALLEHAPERAQEWKPALNLLADVWLREAKHSYRYSQASNMGPIQERDSYGNIYWVNYGRNYNPTSVQPLAPGELLELRPDGKWREMIDQTIRTNYDTTIAELYLKVNEEKLAFPYIEILAKVDEDKANQLAREFLNVWIRNNDPNASRNRTNIYSFSYGYNNRASGIPLTRSKQERNLKDLAKWVRRLKAIEGVKLDSALVLRAFTASHSTAEVYRVESLQAILGDLESLDPKTLANMSQTMRGNLATTWRRPDVQKNAGTNRKQKQIEAEVAKGYAMAQATLSAAIMEHPDSWELKLARASLIHDLANFQNSIRKSSNFAGQRRQALGLFAEAAADYVKTLPDLKTREETVDPFSFWFQAALGATDIAGIDQNTVLAKDELGKIQAALTAIPGDKSERHTAKFANRLFTRLSAVNPAIKNRYLEAGFAIVGDHPQAREARKVYDYYRDLITEIQLLATVDGDTDVGSDPFGVKVEIRFTNNVERESGGFVKYLQNQANAVNGSYNYGRPVENYRDKFEEALRTTLGEQFEVKSVTFNKESALSKADDEYGWRRMSYAYVLLQAKKPEVDRIPPLKLDLDFNDVTGYVVLPIGSPVVAIDASRDGGRRPFEGMEVTQILDERKANDGELALEIKARTTGLVPELDDILDLAPADFEIANIEDQGVAVASFTDDESSVISERLWNVTLKPKAGIENPETFRFAAPKDDATSVIYQRYDDADLVTASLEVSLLKEYVGDEPTLWWLWIVIPAGVLLLIGILVLVLRPKRGAEDQIVSLTLPERLTPFSVLNLLKQIETGNSLQDAHRSEIAQAITAIESHYFGEKGGQGPDLEQVAREWLRRA